MILLLSTSDTDLLSARAAGGPVPYRYANPSRLPLDDLPALLDGADLVVVRLLGGLRAWQDGLDLLLAPDASGAARPVVVLSGEQAPDASLMAASTVPVGIAAEAHAYLAHGGPANLEHLARFLSDTVLLTGHGFDAPASAPTWGPLERTPGPDGAGPVIAVLYYRAHHMSGNTGFVHALCDAVEEAGGRPLPLYVASLRAPEPELIDALRAADAVVTTVLAAGGTRPAEASAGGDDESWDAGPLTSLDVPVLQALCLTGSRSVWEENDEGVSPLDAASQIAVPEFDGRLITVPFSFKEIDADGLPVYAADPERAARVAGIAVRHARLRHIPAADKRIALVLSAYPTKHSRIGNAVGLDTPASAVALLRRLRDEGYDFGGADIPGLASGDGDELIRALIEAGGHDQDWLTEEQLARNPVRIPAADYRRWFAALPEELRTAVEEHWGPAPGEMFVDRSANPDGDIVLAALRYGNLLIVIQPPRGFGENPVAIYHDPDLPPSHHYLAAYRWMAAPAADGGFGADAMIHLGKHGNLEWLPGKNAGLSAACGPDAALGDLPLVYPFLVNDPGEGTQAKRRAHATLVDHLVPPMARADSYGDIARLEQLLDEYAQISSMDPAKLPAIRAQIWTLIQAARLDHDLGLANRPDDDGFDDFLLHVDGWLCEVKDAQIRDGLHVLGAAPTGNDRVNLVLAILRARQIWGGTTALPGLREALGLDESAATRTTADAAEEQARALVQAMDDAGWDPAAVPAEHGEQVAAVLDFAAREVVPRLAATTAELDHTVHALNGGFVPAGPSGSPLRGLVNVLPTGRNFYSVDPKAVPSRLAWETGQALADSLLERYRADNGDWPTSVGLSLWGTSAMRTAGDDVAEALALLGVRPVWDDASRRVTGLEPVPYEELGRPRIDVTLRISGFFRDAFPHTVGLLDDAVRLVAGLDEPAEANHVRAHVRADLADHGDERRATTRIFGSRPGTYGAGLLQLIDSRDWRTDADLAEVYTVWGGYAYGRGLDGRPARDEMETAYRRIAVAAKNTDTREHDIADSDDYFQYHGGMVATVRALRGTAPEAYIGDSTRPETVRTRTLVEEVSRVFRARVVNPRWIEAMRRHGYKGAFELAATVDYLFGYDATTGVVADWMYDKLTEEYVLDPVNRDFLQQANPWALHGIAERLLEAESRGMWEKPDPAVLEALRQVYLETEGELEGED
ncbi:MULTISPECIES: cobaltochelatase subunit CobN [Streptomyces]|uniref:Cobaltochelatase subunit CobN n=1 Tax=Streptomyces tsukubensis (strain DSM 42081 / NBRC 108919 / NRRL 18488 / 9993) TaxID=1114943 RepID=I2N8V8_STRT9|nr:MULTISPECIES: cobaltochelatase subunit CobN [Streptomyces]AZK97312.1 cobaltochelatase subunit CobN [Streptomyces tsukubensis]EIF93455.1 cobaltochelatase subunit CobN [Streptomyces tsukubensis NRRL18488]MYS65254.1 cobaltochelatase subunit CobN [Streptomyces sp. SID5473]QKM66726.1 cobaltochelatase subunit CobN [Streptomyces tsukubensis NRRL18488]TAI44927.1 cobaltochelatase subunit CobN [Streptomyces tsukubensis]